MNYISTRGSNKKNVSSAFAIKTGLASDGGLFMPESLPKIDLAFIEEIAELPYEKRAARISFTKHHSILCRNHQL